MGKYEYVLVCIDLFSGWPEAWSVTAAYAKNTAKKLLSIAVYTYRIPDLIESDRCTHFTREVLQEILTALDISHDITLTARLGRV